MLLNIILKAALLSSLVQPSGDAIPDFSRVGYHWGDKPLPTVENVISLEAPVDGADATDLIQNALDNAQVPGAVLLKAGTYNVYGRLFVRKSGVVLRGEGESTILIAKRYGSSVDNKELNSKGLDKQQIQLLGDERRGFALKSFIIVGTQEGRTLDWSTAVDIKDKKVPVGALSFKVKSTAGFKPGDRIVVYRPGTKEWIHDIKMDQIPENQFKGKIRQWTPEGYCCEFERTIVAIRGRKVILDNPVVMAMCKEYGGGKIMKCSAERTSECGVENMTLISEYNGKPDDEDHAWNAVYVMNAEHSWVRDITSKHFVHSLVQITEGGKNITVQDCTCLEPVGLVKGMRMYAYYISGGELCLVRNCRCDKDRHSFITGVKTAGPNVYTRCTSTNACAGSGPHQRWAMGFLYDCIKISGDGSFLEAQDASNAGSGHGWRGANFVYWNCEAPVIAAQSPWASAQNWFVGCIGKYVPTTEKYVDGLVRPEAVIVSADKHVEPESLYDWQLAQRKNRGEIIAR